MSREYDPTEYRRKNPSSHMLDSGAFALWGKAKEYARKTSVDGVSSPTAFYDTIEYFNYLTSYAEFVKKHQRAIDLYANVDAIGEPGLTWRNQQYLEGLGLHPVPVVHYDPKHTTDIKWLKHYVDREYPIIGLGGLVGSTRKAGCRQWLDCCFEYICNTRNRLPRARLHGFGVTNYELLIRYPWFSVDSATWVKVASFGGIIVPRYNGRAFDYTKAPYIIKMSNDASDQFRFNYHYNGCPSHAKRNIRLWLEYIDVPLGKGSSYGVRNHHTERKQANLKFFEELRYNIRKYPWPFQPYAAADSFRLYKPRGFGFTNQAQKGPSLLPKSETPGSLLIYYSGQGNHGDPEITLDKANIMLTFWDSKVKVDKRFKAVYRNRRRGC